MWLWRNVLRFRELLYFSLQRKQRQTRVQKLKSLSNLLNFTSQFPKQGLPIYLTSAPELSLEKGAWTGCKGPEFPNKISSQVTKHILPHNQWEVIASCANDIFAPGKQRPLLIPSSWCLQFNIQFFHGFTFMIRAIKIDYLLTCLKGMAFIHHILGWAKYRTTFFSINIFFDFFVVVFQTFLATDNYGLPNTNPSIKPCR